MVRNLLSKMNKYELIIEVFSKKKLIIFIYVDSIPKFHHFFPEKREKAVLVIELLGENLYNLLQKHERFSTATIMKIGLQVVSISF